MPLLFLEAPTGLDRETKAKLMTGLTEAMDKTYRFPDTRVFLREYDSENVAQDGKVGDALRPVAFLEAPELSNLDAKRTMVVDIQAVITKFYADLADTEQTLILINQYPLHNVGWLNQLQSDNPMIIEAVKALNNQSDHSS